MAAVLELQGEFNYAVVLGCGNRPLANFIHPIPKGRRLRRLLLQYGVTVTLRDILTLRDQELQTFVFSAGCSGCLCWQFTLIKALILKGWPQFAPHIMNDFNKPLHCRQPEFSAASLIN